MQRKETSFSVVNWNWLDRWQHRPVPVTWKVSARCSCQSFT